MIARAASAPLALAGMALAALAAPAHAKPVVLKPATNWNVDYGDEVCALTRIFGEGKNRHLLTLRQYWPSGEAGVIVAGPAFQKFANFEKTRFRVSPEDAERIVLTMKGSAGSFGPAVIFSTISFTGDQPAPNTPDSPEAKPALEQLAAADGEKVQFLEVQQGWRIIRFDTGPLTEAFRVMNDCTAALAKDWGLEPARLRTALNGPRLVDEAAVIKAIVARYPKGAQDIGEQGVMRLRVIVSPQGEVEECTLIKATATSKLESPACDVMQSATFEPARDATGEPIRAFSATSITYMIE